MSRDMSSASPMPPDAGPAPRSRRGEKRRQALLQAARRLFTRQGYEATSLQQIVKDAGGSLSTAYQLFGCKAAIFRAVILEMAAYVRAQALSEPLLALPPKEALPRIAEQLLAFSIDAEVLAIRRQLIAESHAMPELALEMHEWFEQHLHQPMQAYFRAWVGRDGLADADPDQLTSLFMQMCCSWHTHHLLLGVGGRPEPEEIRRMARTGVALCFLAARPVRAESHGAQGASSS